MFRTKEFRIAQRHKHICKRKRISNNRKIFATINVGNHTITDYSCDVPMEWYPHDGMYDKGKVHCSCRLCKFGRHYGLPTFRDIKEMQKFKSALQDVS